ncbi:MAG: hypothetical protein LBU73_07760 [Helicobacteraceae bacterium]|jgi:hypothetical protein|nr:hypothetical protein [Helicobacteraceae bacterium]
MLRRKNKALIAKNIFLFLLVAIAARAGGNMKIEVENNSKVAVFALNESDAAKELYAQLPLVVKVEDFADNEKIFYPPKKLGAANAPKAANPKAGILAYYAPWGNAVLFFAPFKPNSNLYELGEAIGGAEHIKTMRGEIKVSKAE